MVTYFTNWAQYRQGACKFDASMVKGNLFTHINFAFAKVHFPLLLPSHTISILSSF